MEIKFYNFIALLLFSFILNSATSTRTDFFKNCSYEYTVDLSSSDLLANSSYLYNNNTVIPADLVQEYDFKILDNGTRIYNVKPYKRGCICAVRQCMKFCSNNILDYYEQHSSPEMDDNYSHNVTLNNGVIIKKHLLRDFYPLKSVKKCKKGYTFSGNWSDYNWTLYENSLLLDHTTNINLTLNDYCFLLLLRDKHTYPMVCATYNLNAEWINPYIEEYGKISSLIFYIITILIYRYLPKFKNARVKCLITYLSTSIVLLILTSLNPVADFEFPVKNDWIAAGFVYAAYYVKMANLVWICIMTYDTWNGLTNITYADPSFTKFSIIGWSIPLLITVIAFISTDELPIAFRYTPFGDSRYSKKFQKLMLSALPYYQLPYLIVIIYRLILFVKVVRYSQKHNANLREFFKNLKRQQHQMERYILYFRIFILMGIKTVLDTITLSLIVFGVFIRFYFTTLVLLDAFQGLTVFLVFICNPTVLKEIKLRVCQKFCSRE